METIETHERLNLICLTYMPPVVRHIVDYSISYDESDAYNEQSIDNKTVEIESEPDSILVEDITPGYLLDPEISYLQNITDEASYLEKLSFDQQTPEKCVDMIYPNEDSPLM